MVSMIQNYLQQSSKEHWIKIRQLFYSKKRNRDYAQCLIRLSEVGYTNTLEEEKAWKFENFSRLNCAYNCMWPRKPVKCIGSLSHRIPLVIRIIGPRLRLRLQRMSRGCIDQVSSAASPVKREFLWGILKMIFHRVLVENVQCTAPWNL